MGRKELQARARCPRRLMEKTLRGIAEKRAITEAVCQIAEDRLPRKKKLLFLMHYRHGYSRVDIGALVGVKGEAIGRRLTKINIELKKHDEELREKERELKGIFLKDAVCDSA